MRVAELAQAPSVRPGGPGGRSPRPPAVLWAPAAIVSLAVLLPLAYLAWRTLGAGAEAADLLFRYRILTVILRSLLLVSTVTVVATLLALPLAWLTVRSDLPLRRFWTVVTVAPLVIPSYVGALMFVVALGPKGMLQDYLAPLGVNRLPDLYGYPGALITLSLLSFPYVLLTIRAALWRLDPALEESSRSLGRGPWETFFRVTLPQLRPAIAAGGLLVALYTLSDFGAVSLLRYETFTWSIYIQYESAFNRTLAASLSLVLVAVAVGVLYVEGVSKGRWRYYRSSAGAARDPSIVRLRRWRWPALGFFTVVAALSLALPMSVLGYWAARGIAAGEPLNLLWTATANSMYASGLAAGATVAAGLPVALLAVRYPGRLAALLERVTYIGFALPGIAIALSLVFFGANFALPLYQTTALLIFAYVVLFLPAAVGAARTSLMQVSPQLEEAARSLGRKPWQAFATITLPLILPGILAGAGMVFLLTMKELPATLILGPIGFKTLSTSIWSAASEAFFARAAIPALFLIVVSSLSVALILGREKRTA